MPENPNQPEFPINPGPSGPQEDDPLTRAFIDALGDVRKSMVDLVDTNRSLMKAMGQPIAPNVSSGSSPPPRGAVQGTTASPQGSLFDPRNVGRGEYTDFQQPPAATPSNASTPGRARKILGGIYRSLANTPPPMSAVEEEQIAEGSGSQPPMGGGSTPPGTGSPGDPSWLRTLRPYANKGITIPRYGEFTAQDILGLGAHAAAKIAVPNQDSKFGAATGRVGEAFSAMSELAPYFHVLESKTGIQLAPRATQAQASSMGYARGGADVNVGPFGMTIPGSQFFGPAGREGLKEDWQAIKIGAGAGISTKEARELQEALKGQGYSGNDLHRLTKVIAGVKADKSIGNIGSDETTATIVDQMMRYGTNSIDKLRDSLKGLGEIAQKSRMSVDEVKNSLNEFANDQQQKGATYTQGYSTGKQFMETTGLDARLLSGFQNNSIVQGMTMARTGLLPQQFGALPLGSQMEGIYKSMDLLGGAFGNLGAKKVKTPYGEQTVSAQQQQDALVAQQLGTTPDVIGRMRRERKRNVAGSYLEQAADQYDTLADSIHGKKASDADKRGQFSKLFQGKAGAPGMDKMMTMMRDAGFSEEEIKKVQGQHTWDQADMIHKLMQKKQGDLTNQGQTVTIEMSPELRKWLKMHAPADDKKSANNGKLRINTAYGGTPSPRGGLGYYMVNNGLAP